ncbi:9421_t:CDS:2 [Gigaspora margarita]|uniref:9421_t:CDS:1 n=1 Tax=Gigaspora margarita TaxID=4874 RepID=A0ABN7UMQ9_GIGMA|nr:9421_t:CDS:2 [Gigaspora margarita]
MVRVEKEQTGNFIDKISLLKGNEAMINHWIADKTKRSVTLCKGCHCNDPKIERLKCTKKINIKRLEKIIGDSKCRLKIYWEDLRYLQRDNKIERKTKAVEGTTKNKYIMSNGTSQSNMASRS